MNQPSKFGSATSTFSIDNSGLKQRLTQLDIEPSLHEPILLACMCDPELLNDIEACELEGELDSNAAAITADVAQILVKKLQLSLRLSQLDIDPNFHSLLLSVCNLNEKELSEIQPQDLKGKLAFNGAAISTTAARVFVRKLQKYEDSKKAAEIPSSGCESHIGVVSNNHGPPRTIHQLSTELHHVHQVARYGQHATVHNTNIFVGSSITLYEMFHDGTMILAAAEKWDLERLLEEGKRRGGDIEEDLSFHQFNIFKDFRKGARNRKQLGDAFIVWKKAAEFRFSDAIRTVQHVRASQP